MTVIIKESGGTYLSAYIEVEGLSKVFEVKKVIDQLSFSMQKGEILSIIGPSGSGKSTLLRILLGLEDVTEGSIRVEGREVSSDQIKERDIGIVFQKPMLFPHMTVLENVIYGLRMKQEAVDSHYTEAYKYLEKVEMENYSKHYPNELSGGQQHIISLIRTLVLKPKLLLLDEPFNHLDPGLRASTAKWVKQWLRSEGITTIFVTHDVEEVRSFGDRIALMNNGEFEQIGYPDALYFNPATPLVASFYSNVLVLEDGLYLHVDSLKYELLDADNSINTELKWKAHVVRRLYHPADQRYQVEIPSLNQKIELPSNENLLHKKIWIYSDSLHLQSFKKRVTKR